MFNILSSFLVGFLSTAFLFIMSVIIVLGIKTLLIMIKDLAVQNTPPVAENKKPSPPKRKKRKVISPQRSIEIDPSQIDRIYVKKSS